MKVYTKTSVRTVNTACQSTSANCNNQKSTEAKPMFMRWLFLVLLVVSGAFTSVSAQLTGPKAVPGDYPTLAAAITDLNTQGVGVGGVTITVSAAQTAPAGGYVIGGPSGAALLSSSSNLNPVIIDGAGNTVTAGLQTAGNLNDGIFKLVGADWITVRNFTMQENPANTVIAVASNTMTEWGVALLILDATNGAQNNTIQNNIISLNNTYTNSFGVYSSTRHIDGPNSIDVTSLVIISNNTTAPNHGNKVYGNTISNVNTAFIFVGANSTVNQDVGNDIGGSSLATGNTVTGWGVAGPTSTAYPAVSTAIVEGVYIGNQMGYNFSFNSLISGSLNSGVGVRAVILDYTNAPASACTNNFNSNTLTVTQAGAGQLFLVQHGTIGPVTLTGVTMNSNSNNFINSAITSSTGALFFGILNFAIYDVINMNSNIFRNNVTNSTTGGFAAINCQNGGITGGGLTINQLNINNNQFGDAGGGPITYTATTTSPSTVIGVSSAATTCAVSISGNTFRGYSFVSTTTNAITFIANSSTSGNVTINNNNFGTAAAGLANYTTNGANTITCITQTGVVAPGSTVSVQNNDFRGINYAAGATGAVFFINETSGTATNVTVNVSGNTFNNLSINTTGAVTFMGHSFVQGAGGSTTINNNSIVGNFTKLGTAGNVVIATNASSPQFNTSLTMTGNNFSNISAAGSSAITGFTNIPTSSNQTKTITGNTFNNWTSVTGAIIGMTIGGFGNNNVSSVSNNTFTNITGQSTITGININAAPNGASVLNVNSNTVTGLSSTGTGGSVTGLSCSNASGVVNIATNTIGTLSSSGASSTVVGLTVTGSSDTRVTGNNISGIIGTGATSPIANGISVTGGLTVTLNGNKICNVAENAAISTTAGAANGMLLSGGLNVTATNNLIADIRTPLANLGDALRGIAVTSSTALSSYNLYNNTIYLNAASTGTNFGTSGIFHTASATATTAKLDLRSNIVANNSSANGTGVAAALRRGTTTGAYANYATTSNYNLYYAGTPSATHAILNDNGTVYGTAGSGFAFGPVGTVGSFQNQVTASRESLSFTSVISGTPGVFFQDFDCSNAATFLHIVNGLSTRVEGGGIPIPGVTADYDGTTRSTSNPDIGADEFNGTSVAPVISGVTVPTASCTVAAHAITATVTTPSGSITTVTLNYNNGAPGSVVMTTGGGGIYTGSIPAGTAGTTVTWTITAVSDVPASTTFTGASYTDDPLVNFTTSVTASVNPVCSGSATVLTAVFGNAAPSYTAPPAVSSATTDEDLGNITITQGVTTILNNSSAANSLAGTIGTATGTVGSYSNFTAFGPFTLNPGGVYNFSISSNTASVASNFTNAVAIWIDYNKNGLFNDAGETVYLQPSLISGPHTITGTFTVPANAATGLTRMRLLCNEGAITGPTMSVSFGEYEEYMLNILPVVTGISWSAGGPSIGTTNPITVSPLSATTYTATISAQGCTKSPSLLVNTNVLPPQPVGSNSTQCGFGVPSNTVATQFVLPDISTGAFRWYDAPFPGGTLLQSGGNTYTGTINATTTFYVSEFNGTCESPRTALVATVNQPDQISAHVDFSNPCVNTPIQLSVTNDAVSPVNIYGYTWSATPGAGSGIVGSPTGTPLTITPTVAGTYTYRVDAYDPGPTPPSTQCATFATITVIVKPAPVLDSVRANPGTLCAGVNVNLGAYSATTVTGPITPPTGYCLPTYSSGTGSGDWINSAQILGTTLNNVSGAAGTPFFTLFPQAGSTTASLTAGIPYTFRVQGGSFSTCIIRGWIDYNRNGVYEASETIGVSPNVGASAFGNFTFTIPYSAQAGVTRLRIRSSDTSPGPGTGDVCAATNSGFGEGEDYIITVIGVNPQDPALTYNWSWLPANTASGANLIVNPSVNTTYNVTATGVNGCVSLPGSVSVTVNPLPALPSGTNSSQCGTRIPEASVSSNSGAPVPVFRWYDAPTGGNLLQQDISSTYLTAISVTQEFYVTELSAAGCEGPRVHITASVITPDAIQAIVSAGPYCMNSPITLNTNFTQVNNTYNFVWTATPTANSGMPNPVSGDDGNGVDGGNPVPVVVTATLNGTYTYTVTANDPIRQCTTSSSVVVNINPLPTNIVAGSTGVPCVGSTIGLTATANSGGIAPINFSTGFEGTFPPTGWTIINNSTGGSWNAATATPAPHGGTQTMRTVRVVGQPTDCYAFTPSLALIGGHTYTITYWYNTVSLNGNLPENLRIKVGTAASVAAQTTTLSTQLNITTESWLQGTTNYTAPASGNYFFSFNAFALANTSNVLALDDVAIVDATPLVVTSYNWTSDNSNPVFTSNQQNPTGVTINQTTTYTVTVTNSVGCSASGQVTVTPNTLPASPIGTNSDQCGLRVPTASVATGGVNGTFRWYNAQFNGTLLQTGGSTYTTAIGTTTTFWVSESNGTCESLRTPVTVNVVQPDPVTAHVDFATICANNPIILSATNDNPVPTNTYVYTWTATPVPGSGIPTNLVGTPQTVTPTLNGTYSYLVTAFDAAGPFGGCTVTSSVNVLVNPNPVIDSIRASALVICAGASSNLSVYSSAVISGPITPPASPAAPTYSSGTGFGDWIQSVQIIGTTLNNVSGASATPFFTIFPQSGSTTCTLTAGQTYTIQVGGGSFSTCIIRGWIDYNRNGAMDATETIGVSPNVGANGTNTFTFTVPAGASAGATRLRLRSSDTSPGPGTADVSGATNSGFGEGEEYIITVNAVLAQNPGMNYTWSWPPSNTASGANITVSPTINTTYTATVQNPATLCQSTATISVTVAPVTAAPTATPSVVCAGAPVVLAANAGGGGPFTYVWTDDNPLTTDPISTAASFTVNPIITTVYSVVVTDGCGNSTVPVSVPVTVNPLPTSSIAEGPGPLTLCNPLTQTLTAVTTTGSPSYQWTLNGVNINLATGPTYTVSGVSSGTYRVRVTETTTGCNTTSAGVVVTINPSPSGVTAVASPNPICIGFTSTLTANANPTSLTPLSENFDGVTVPALPSGWTATNASGVAPLWVTSNAGTPTPVFFSSPNVAFIDDPATVSDKQLTSPAVLILSATAQLTFRHNFSFESTFDGGVLEISIGGGAFTDIVTAGGNFVTGGYNATISSSFSNPIGGRQAWSGSSGATFVLVTVNLPASAAGQTVVLRWRMGSDTSASSTGWRLDNIVLTDVLPPATFAWTASPLAGSGLAGGETGSPLTITPTLTGSYTYTVTASNIFGCSTSANSTPLVVNPRPTGVLSGAATYCANTTVPTNLSIAVTGTGPWSGTLSNGTAFSGNSSPITVTVPAPLVNTTYTIATLVDANCSALPGGMTGSATIIVNPIPNAPIISIVDNTNGTSTITATNYSGILTWSNGGSDNPHIVIASGPYTVTQTDGNGCISNPSNIVTAGPSITADPALGNMDITDLADVSQNANVLPHAQVLKLKLPVYNFEQDFAVPNGATTITIDLGSKLVLNPSFVLATAPLSAYFTWTHTVVLGHDIITGSQIAALPGDFDNTAVFEVISSGSCISDIEANFVIDNHASVIALNDLDPNNNFARLQYALPTTVSATSTNVVCNGAADGTITITASEGTTVTVNGNPPQATYGPGTYTIVASAPSDVAPFTPCTATTIVTITEPPLLVPNIFAQVNVTGCFGDHTGSAAVFVTGGTPFGVGAPYLYSWNTVPVQTTPIAVGLGAGTYTVTVTDANGCIKTANVTITEPTQVVATISTQTNVDCFGNNTGSATVSVVGGTPFGGPNPYTYSWNTIPTQTTATATGLAAGTYVVQVTDSHGCTATASVTITQPPVLGAIASVVNNVTCNGRDDGSATVAPSGGTAPYTYLWSNGQTTQTITDLAPGGYSVVVTDAHGCIFTSNTVTITQPNVLTIAINGHTNNSCHGGSTGTITVDAAGGTIPYLYTIAGPTVNNTGLLTGVFTGLSAGTYTITVTDANGCTAISAPVSVTQPSGTLPDISLGSDYITNFFASNGAATTIVYNVAEIAGNPATGDTIRITRVAGYTFTFNQAQTANPINPLNTLDNPRWKINTSNPAFISLIFDPAQNSTPGTLNCQERVYVAITMTRNTPNLSTFTLSARLRRANTEVNLGNNLNSIVFTAE